MEIFLYEWWPLVRQQNLYRRLSDANVEVRPYSTEKPEAKAATYSFATKFMPSRMGVTTPAHLPDRRRLGQIDAIRTGQARRP